MVQYQIFGFKNELFNTTTQRIRRVFLVLPMVTETLFVLWTLVAVPLCVRSHETEVEMHMSSTSSGSTMVFIARVSISMIYALSSIVRAKQKFFRRYYCKVGASPVRVSDYPISPSLSIFTVFSVATMPRLSHSLKISSTVLTLACILHVSSILFSNTEYYQ